MRPNAQGDGWRLKWCGMNVDTEISRVRMQMMTGTGSHFRDNHTNRYKSIQIVRIISFNIGASVRKGFSSLNGDLI